MLQSIITGESFLQKMWWWLRQISGDAAYENYLAHGRGAKRPVASSASETDVMTRAQFYADSLRRKYSGISRCC